MKTTQPAVRSKLNPDRWIPRYFVFFFLGLIAVQAVLVTLAVRTQTGVVTQHPYEKGLAYNQVVDASDKQVALGWKATVEFQSDNSNMGVVSVVLRDSKGQVLLIDDATLSVSRPTQDGLDFSVALSPSAQHVMQGEVRFPMSGVWDLRVFTSSNGIPYQQSKRVIVK